MAIIMNFAANFAVLMFWIQQNIVENAIDAWITSTIIASTLTIVLESWITTCFSLLLPQCSSWQ